MGKVYTGASMSLDGFIAGHDEQRLRPAVRSGTATATSSIPTRSDPDMTL